MKYKVYLNEILKWECDEFDTAVDQAYILKSQSVKDDVIEVRSEAGLHCLLSGLDEKALPEE